MIPGVEIVRPGFFDEALAMRADLGMRGMPIAGGTDVIVELRGRGAQGITLIDLTLIDEMKGIHEEDGGVRVGALTTHEEAANSALLLERAAALSEACSQVGSLQIRNRGTLGGNVANAAPCADGLTALVCLEARARLASLAGGTRELLVEDLIERPYRTGIAPGELILDFFLPAPGGARSAFIKLGRRDALAISRINAACLIAMEGDEVTRCRLAVGSVMPRTQRVREAEEGVEGRRIGVETAAGAGEAVAVRMKEMSGVRWSTPYKEPAVRAIVKRAVLGAMGLNE